MVIRRASSWIWSSWKSAQSSGSDRRPRGTRKRRADHTLDTAAEVLEERTLLTGPAASGMDFADGVVLVGLKEGHSVTELDGVVPGADFQKLGDYGVVKVTFEPTIPVAEAIEKFTDHPALRYVEPDFIGTLDGPVIPNDQRFSEMWGMHNVGQAPFNGLADADIDAPEAWEYATGSDQIVVAVIDSGIDYRHPDLRNNMWVNPGEVAGDGIDNDGNGFVDDVHGWDFFNNDNDPFDGVGHGTHVAGTIGAEGNDGRGVTGVNWDVSLMALKIGDDTGSSVSFSAAIQSLNYAVSFNVPISNNSYGGFGFSQALYDAVNNARSNNHLFVAAAGNDGLNIENIPVSPGGFDLDNVISVAASDFRDTLTGFSNYAATVVDIAAPGFQVLSTTPTPGSFLYNPDYDFSPGTSMASPHVAGVAALALSVDDTLTYTQLRDAILDNVDQVASMAGRVATGGRLNAFKVIDAVRPKFPSKPTMLSPNGVTTDATPTFAWSAANLANTYELIVSEAGTGNEISHINGLRGTSYTPPTPLAEGSYVAIVRAFSDAGLSGEFSDPISFTVNVPTPATPGFLSPTGTLKSSQPLFSWTSTTFASRYELDVTNRTTGQRVIYVDDLSSTQYSHFLPLKDGSYRATVRAINEVGEIGRPGETTFSISVPAPVAVDGVAPTGLVDDTLRPTFQWTSVAGADIYELWVNDLTRGIRPTLHQDNIRTNSFTPTSDLLEGSYRVWVRGKTASGLPGPWSDYWNFQIDIPTPEVPQFLTPDTTFVDSLLVDMTWTAAANAASYDLWVNNRSTGESQIIREQELTTEAYSFEFEEGRYTAWVRAHNLAGEDSAWSAPALFVVDVPVPDRPVATGPAIDGLGATADSTPTFSWTAVDHADHYDLWVRNLTTGEDQVIRETNLPGTSFTPTTALAENEYVFWVRAINAANEEGPWSLGYRFRVDTPRPTTPVLFALPSTITDSTPRFSWSVPQHATRFQLYIQNITLKTVDVRYVSGSFYVPRTPLANGTYQVWIRAFNDAGEASGWSSPIRFILVADAENIDASPLAGPDDELQPQQLNELELFAAATIDTPRLTRESVEQIEPVDQIEQPVDPRRMVVADHPEQPQQSMTVELARAERDRELEAIMAALPNSDWMLALETTAREAATI